MKYLFSLFLLISLQAMPLAQDLSIHQWKNRLLLILSKSPSLPLYKEQIDSLQHHTSGLKERKLLVYQALPSKYLSGENAWQPSGNLYQKHKQTNAPFEVLLIGLDGGVKLRRTSVLSCTELFAIIDGMPMRRAELRRQKN